MSPIRRLVLWDVDGTLVRAGDLGAAVFDVALEADLGARAARRVAGARCLLVATGRYTLDYLAALDADAVLADLSDTKAVLDILM